MKRPEKKPQFIDDSMALAEFADLLIEISCVMTPESSENRLYMRNISPALEKIVAYDYRKLEKDVRAGRLPEEEMFLYQAMSIMRNRLPDFEGYRATINRMVRYFKGLKGEPDAARLKDYKESLQEFATKIIESEKIRNRGHGMPGEPPEARGI